MGTTRADVSTKSVAGQEGPKVGETGRAGAAAAGAASHFFQALVLFAEPLGDLGKGQGGALAPGHGSPQTRVGPLVDLGFGGVNGAGHFVL